MIHPRIDELLNQVDSRYALVIVAAKRARQINNYHHQLGEGTFDEFAPPLIQSRSKNYLTMALEETAEGKIVYEYTSTALYAAIPPVTPSRTRAMPSVCRQEGGTSRSDAAVADRAGARSASGSGT